MTRAMILGACALGLVGCASESRDNSFATATGAVTTGPGAGDDDGSDSPNGSDGSGANDDGEEGGEDDDGPEIRFDTENDNDIEHNGGDNEAGCEKVDFLFVIDNSGSMSDEQENLIASFPGFISEIEDTLMAQDYQILVTDTDASGGGSCQQSICCGIDCQQWCQQCQANGCTCTCNGNPCPVAPTEECDVTLGAGKTESNNGNDCGIEGGNRYMLETQPDLTGTFQCAAKVGTGGDGNEKPMESVIEAITTLNPPGECNANFLRDDAILVATVITDEEDLNKSAGNPGSWKQAIVDAKNGDEKAVVPLALVGDTNVQNPVCDPYDNGGNGAEDAPRLREWAESFPFGIWGSVCSPDYTQFFSEAVSVIDTACDEFVPEG